MDSAASVVEHDQHCRYPPDCGQCLELIICRPNLASKPLAGSAATRYDLAASAPSLDFTFLLIWFKRFNLGDESVYAESKRVVRTLGGPFWNPFAADAAKRAESLK
jgi:hypothetical protein